MKKHILLIIISSLFLLSCKSEIKNENSVIDSIPKKKEYLSAYKIIYGNASCLDQTIESLPIIELESDTIFPKSNIQGKLFFSLKNLRQLATCNNLDYKISFDVYNANRRHDTSIVESKGDTIFFSLSYDSLKLMSSTKKIDNFLLQGVLRASYFKENEVLGYDTMMPIRKNIFVIKK